MSGRLARWNELAMGEAAKEILPCCGSTAWSVGMAARRPIADEATLLAAADETWRNLAIADWMEAFRSHPKIGESRASQPATALSTAWSTLEQKSVAVSADAIRIELAQANQEYERRFGHIFIVSATGKSAEEILEILRNRLRKDSESEFHEAARQQMLITHLRLKKWLSE